MLRTIIKKIILFPLIVINYIADFYNMLISFIKPSLGYFWLDRLAEKNKNLTQEVTHKLSNGDELKLKLYTPNWRCRYGVESFSRKEPETLKWIDEYGGDGVLFDIGANVGLYSLYYAAVKKSKVYAFEPSVFNLALLAKNISINNLSHLVQIITNPISKENKFADFSLSMLEEGGTISSFGVEYGHDGKPLNKTMSYQTLGFSLDFLLQNNILSECPKMIKIDVDGIEHLILAGATQTLRNPKCRTVLIEVAYDFLEQSEGITKILTDCGFTTNQSISDYIGRGDPTDSSFNQIWIKK